MIEVFTAIGIVTVIISGLIAVIGTLLIIRDWWLTRQDLRHAQRLVVRRPLIDCSCKMPPLMKGQRADCPIHGVAVKPLAAEAPRHHEMCNDPMGCHPDCPTRSK